MYIQINPQSKIPKLTENCFTAISKELDKKIMDNIKKNRDKYNGRAHFIRCAIIEKIKRESNGN